MSDQKELDSQLQMLLEEFKSGNIKSAHELMKLIDMVYKDWIEFHPEEKTKMQRQLHGDLYVKRARKDSVPGKSRKKT